jgi:HEAT repeat protein
VKRRYIYIALAIAAGALFTGLSFKKSEPLRWDTTDRQSYAITATTVAQAVSDVSKYNQRIDLKGTLNMRVCEVTDENVTAAFQFSPVKIEISGVTNPQLEKSVSSLFFADMTREGKFLNFRFNVKEVSLEESHAISDILRSIEFVVKKYAFLGSTSVETEDTDGSFKVRYAYGKQIGKVKKSYTHNKGNTADIKRSKGTAEYDRQHSWITRGEYSDFVVYYSQKKAMLKVSCRTNISLTDTPELPLAIWSDTIDSRSSFFASETTLTKTTEEPALVSALTIPLSQFKIQAAELLMKNTKYDGRCLESLIRLIKSCPEAADYIPTLLQGAQLNAIQKVMLVHALERTGTPAAEKNLVRIMREPLCGEEARMQAVVGLGTFAAAGTDTTDALWLMFKGKDDVQLRNAAVLSLGVIAKDAAGDQPERIKDKIRNGLASASDDSEKSALLFAAGNTADTGMIPVIEKGLADGKPNIRSSAAGALSYMEDKEVTPILSDMLKNEENPNVRSTIASTLYKKAADDNTVESVITALKKEDNENVRAQMYRYLLKNRDEDGVKDELTKMLPNENSLANRNIIITALGTQKKKKETKQQR